MLRQLAGQTAIYGISSIVARLINYLLTPYLTRIMTTGEYGVITDMYAVIPFAMVVLTMGLETGYFRFAGLAPDATGKRAVFSTAFGTTSLAALIFFGATLLFLPQLSESMGYPDHPSFIWMVGAIIALDVMTTIPFARLREEGKALRFVWIRVLSVVINVALCLFFYSALPLLSEGGWDLAAAAWVPSFGAGYVFAANLIASFVTLLLLIPTFRDAMPRISKVILIPILIYSFPLLISGIAGTANQFIDRQMIKYLMPEGEWMEALGVYGAVVKIGVVLVLFTQMYRFAAEPFFLSNFKKEDFLRANAEALKYFTIVSVGIFLMITLFSDLFALIVGEAFREGMRILPLILLANIFSGMTLNLSFWYKQTGQTRYAIYVTGVGLVITLAMSFALVPVMGYMGAAWARLGCEAVMLVLSYYYNHRHYPTPYNLRRIGGYFLLGGALYAVGLVGIDNEVLKYFVHLLLLAIFALYAVRRENIDVAGMISSIVKRKI